MLAGFRIEKTAGRKTHTVVYEARGPAGEPLRLEEIELPAGLTEADQARVTRALGAFPEMKLAFWHEHAYLAVPLPEGSWLETRLRWSDKPPSQAEVQRWSVQVAKLVAELVSQGNPVSGECLRPEAWFLTRTGELVLLDPGLNRLLWGEVEPASVAGFGRLLEHWTAGSAELTTSYAWIVARCKSERSDQAYADFRAVLQALEDRPLVQAGDREHYTRKPVLQGFKLPRLAAPPTVPPLVLGLGALLVIGSLLLWGWLSRPAPPRAGPAVAVVMETRLELLDPVSGKRLSHKVLESPALSMVRGPGILYLSLKNSNRILALDDRTLESARPKLLTDGAADKLSLSPDGKWLYAHMIERAVLMVFELPERAAYLELLPPSIPHLAPGPVNGQPGFLLVDPPGSRLEAIQLARTLMTQSAVMDITGPAVADPSGGWWVASGRRLLHLDGQLKLRGERRLAAQPLGFAAGLILEEGRLSRLDEEGQTLPLEGVPVAASRSEDGSWWVATRSPDRLVQVRKDLSGVMLERELSGPPVGAAWLP